MIPLSRTYREADLLIAGDGRHGDALKALARDMLGVRFLGRLPWPELRRYYAQALALIVPSRCFEMFGRVAERKGDASIASRLRAAAEVRVGA